MQINGEIVNIIPPIEPACRNPLTSLQIPPRQILDIRRVLRPQLPVQPGDQLLVRKQIKENTIRLRRSDKLRHFLVMPLACAAEHVVPQVEQPEPVVPPPTLERQDVLDQLRRVQVGEFLI